jgi:dihydrofolate reductase
MGFIGPWMKQIGGIIVGRVTYDQSIGMGGWMWGKTPALVLTSRPIEQGPQTIHVHGGDPGEGLTKLRQRMSEKDFDTDIWLFGGGVTAGLFLKHNLIDLVELASCPWRWARAGRSSPALQPSSLRARLIPAHRHGLRGQQLPAYREEAARSAGKR